MAGVRKPVSVPDGPLKELNDALHELYTNAHRPALIHLAREINEYGASKSNLDKILRGYLPPRPYPLTSLVRALARHVPELQEKSDEIAEKFLLLWKRANKAECAPAPPFDDSPEETNEGLGMQGYSPVVDREMIPYRSFAARLLEFISICHMFPRDRDDTDQSQVAGLILLLLGLGISFGLGRGLANEFGDLAGYATLSAGCVVATVSSRRYIVHITIPLACAVLAGTAFDRTRLAADFHYLDPVDSVLCGVLIGVLIFLIAADSLKIIASFNKRGIGGIWLGIVLVAVFALGAEFATMEDAGTRSAINSLGWITVDLLIIGLGVFLSSGQRQ